jgi:hypothetical protein
MVTAWVLGLLTAPPLSAQEPLFPWAGRTDCSDGAPDPVPGAVPPQQAGPVTTDGTGPAAAPSWRTVWGVAGLRVIPDGPKVAPNGEEYHPNFSMDLDLNLWLWRSQRLYLFGDLRLWGEKGEYGVTNARDGFLGTSKREFDLEGGVAWNYAGPWEARAFGYTLNNLNRGKSPVVPDKFGDGFGLENRYYLSSEYADLGQTGFDVTRATFLSVGYYPSKVLVGNDGQAFKPGLLLRAYLTYDLWDWPCYVFGDVRYIGDRSFRPRLLVFDVGVAARPFRACEQCEFRLGAENTGDFQAHNVLNLWYASVRFVF